MSDYLAAHPEIFMARKEMHFFGADLRFASHFYRRAEREYLSEFSAWTSQSRAGEASVWYLYSETAAAEIKAFNPAARIIIMLREPADMIHSLFRYFRYDGNEPLDSFADALEAEPERRLGRRLGRQTYFPAGLIYHDTARFASQVERYFHMFGRQRVHVVLHEDLAANPAAVYSDTLKFLEVDSTHSLPQFARVNQAKTVKSRALRALLNDPALRSVVLAARPLLPRPMFGVFQRLQGALTRVNSAVEKAAPLELKLKAELRRHFEAETARLGDLIDRDLSHWSNPPALMS